MILKRPQKQKRVSLKGAVQINRNSYFVYADEGGKMFLKNGNDERLQKAVVKNMIKTAPQRMITAYHLIDRLPMAIKVCGSGKNCIVDYSFSFSGSTALAAFCRSM